ncbi:MAG TPA: hypothetical protein VN758_03810 [Solirubrobacterales bacterium]|nr:hypothetical protein [Solirubrobacterales bacterium]
MLSTEADKVTVVTLGPEGTCHERAVQRYLAFQGVDEYRIELITDFFAGLELVREQPNTFLVQCSAHPKVHEVTEKYWTEVFVVDTFIYPTKHLVLLSRREVERPRSIGIVPATKGYVDLSQWEEVIDVVSKPVVGEGLLRGDYDSGLTHIEHFEEHTDELQLDLDIGEIDTTWVVYGREKRFKGEVIGIPSAQLFRGAEGPDSAQSLTAAG